MYRSFNVSKDFFYFSEYLDNSRFYDVENKKIIVSKKDEIKGLPIFEFAWLKSMIYSYRKWYNEGDKKVKGINKNIVKNITHEEYENTTFEKKQRLMKWEEYEVNPINLEDLMSTISLSCFDDKWYMLDDGIKSLTYEHKTLITWFNWLKRIFVLLVYLV